MPAACRGKDERITRAQALSGPRARWLPWVAGTGQQMGVLVTMKMVKRALAAGAALSVLACGPALAGWSDINLRAGVTPLSREIYDLHMMILWICVAIGVVVFGAMIYAMVKFRKSKGAVPADARPQHQGRDHLDRHPGRDPGRHGDSGGARR